MPLDADRFKVRALAKASDARAQVADILLPPPDIDVAEAAELYRVLYNPQGYSGPWRHALTPPLVRPMQACSDPRYDMVVYVGPAQDGKTEIGLNFCAHSIRVDPADFQIVLPEKQQAEDFSERRLGRMVAASPELGDRLRSESKFASVFAQSIVNLSWPTSANASSKPVPRNWLDEYDSMKEDVDGEGDAVALYHKRSQTFGARRKTLVTSSPKRPKIKGTAKPTGAHEAVTTTGVLAYYNEGTRRHMYWPCRECGEYFVTRVADIQFGEGATAGDAHIDVWFACPHCGGVHTEDDRNHLFVNHEWLAEGESIDRAGVITGELRNTTIDSYRKFGPQASFITLEELVRKRLKAEEVREKTGSDSELRTFWNVDAGEVYESDAESEALSPDELKGVAADLAPSEVPDWAPVLVASIDVQSDRFEVMWTAFGAGDEGAIVDHTKIVAIRADGTAVTVGKGSGGAESAADLEACDPATNAAHWRALVAAVFDKPLRLTGDATKGLVPVIVAIDTGGKAGATANAYAFARWLRRFRPDLHRRAMFLKGTDTPNPVRVWKSQWDPKTSARRPTTSYSPDAKRKPTNRVGVELYLVAVGLLKDAVKARLQRAVRTKGARGEGTLHVSRHLPAAIFDQLCAESRDADGEWVNERRVANEAWDLSVYAHAAYLKLGGERINWQRPPAFAVVERQAREIEAAGAPKPKPAAVRRSLFRGLGRI